MHRTSDDQEDQLHTDGWVTATELITRISAEHGEPRPDVEQQWVDVSTLIARVAAEHGEPLGEPDRHRLRADPDRRRSRRRRLAPVVVGVATVLVATTVALTLRSGGAPAGPELSAALVGAGNPSAASATVPAPADPDDAQADSSTAAPDAPAARRAVAAPTAPSTKPAAPVAADGVQAAQENGWKLVDRDEFTGTALNPKWGPYDSKGNAGKGRRTPDAITVSGGVAKIHGDAKGTTGGMAWDDDRRTGRWEMRAKFPAGDVQYHPVLLLWPRDGGSDDGEVDFAETTSASNGVSFFLHHGSGDPEAAKKQIDITQWHNYAVEVTSDGVTGYIDGQKWFESTDRDTLPRGPVHPVIQLDWFPKGDSPQPSDLLVDWMRIYE